MRERAELPRLSLYSLRHYFASFLIVQGALVTGAPRSFSLTRSGRPPTPEEAYDRS